VTNKEKGDQVARTVVAKRSDFKDLTGEELKEQLREKGLKQSGSKEEQIQRLVEASYPVFPLPKGRQTSARGAVIFAFVDPDGTPKKDVQSDEKVAKQLVEKGLINDDAKALRTVKLYKYNLVRYYGYSAVETDEGTRFVKR